MKQLYLSFVMALLCAVSSVAQPISVSTFNVAYNQNFNSLSNTTPSNLLPNGWYLVETGTGTLANGQYSVGTGSSNTGDAYSFGAAGSSERALGSLRSGSVLPLIGAGFVNNTGGVISSLQLSYRGEQWRLGAVRANDRVDFQISFDATAINNGTWTNIDQLDFISPINSGTVGALDGNAAANSANIAFEIAGLNITPGQNFFVRWVDFDVTSSDDGLAIDDFSITAVGVSQEPSITFDPAFLSFGDVNAGTSKTLSYEVLASNLSSQINVSSENSLFALSTDNVSFNSAAVLPAEGGILYLRFSPTANGNQSTVLTHVSGEYEKTLSANGFGFVQAENIIDISSARAASVGTKVTIAGRVTVGNEHGNPAFIQDQTGGLPVFSSTLANDVAIGDSVIVTGPIGVFNEQKQISGAGIFYTKVDAAPRVIAPKIISLSELAANEGLLVTVEDVQLVNKSFVFYPQSTERITDGVQQADLRIDGDTNIPGLAKPQGIFDITGVVGRFRTNAQLLPRFQSDVPGAVEPTTVTDTIPRALTFDVVNWNLEFFGARSEDYANEEYGPADEALQLTNIKNVLTSLDADVIAVQEVSDEAYFGTLVEQLGKYKYICSHRFSYSFQGPGSDFPPQKLCLVYDTTTVSILSARPMFEALYDEARTTNAALLPGYPTGDPSSFWSSGRLPFLINAKANIQGVQEKISFVVLHAKSGSTVSDFNRRVYDGQVLKDSLNAHYANQQVIILGDLNDDLDQSIVSGKPSSYSNFVNDTAYVSITKSLSEAGARSTVSFQDVIDHQIITSNLQEEYLRGSATIVAPFRQITNYATTTSDHLPVISRFAFTGPVVSFATTSVQLSEDSSSLQVEITVSKPFVEDKSIAIALSGTAENGQDFLTDLGVGNNLSIMVPAGATSVTFNVDVIDDSADELLELVAMNLLPGSGYELGNPTLELSITDNDVPTVSFVNSYTQVREGSSNVIVLALSTPVAEEEKIYLSLAADKKTVYGTDYTTDPIVNNDVLELTVPAGSASVSFTFEALADKRREFIELITYQILNTTSGLIPTAPTATVVGIEDVRVRPIFTVYPNPTNDLITLVADDFDVEETVAVELREISGNVIFSGSSVLSELNTQIEQALVNKRRGVYLLSVVCGDETTSIRILKN